MGIATVPKGCFTPLYACPELARLMLDKGNAPTPAGAMDIWGAGVVLLDVLAKRSAFAETKAGLDLAGLFNDEAVPFEYWYCWLADDPAPFVLDEYVDAPGIELLNSVHGLRYLLQQMLAKEPAQRVT